MSNTEKESSVKNRLAALEAQVQQLSDSEAIRQLLASYGPLADTADTAEGREQMGALFSDNGVYDLGYEWQATGQAAIGELLNNPDHLALVANGSAHVMGLPFITVEGDTATALSYSRVYRHADGEFTVWRVSANRWECARVDGRWQVTRRINRLLNGNEEAKSLLRGS